MRTSTLFLPANTTQEYSLSGNYFLVRQSAIDLTIENPLTSEKVEASQGDDFQFQDFKSLLITNSTGADQVIKLTVSNNKKAGSAKVGGSVTVSGSVTLANGALTQGRASVTNANQAIIAANANRRYLLIQNNDPAAVLRITVDGNAATASAGFRVEAGSSFELPTFAATSAINAIMETATATANNVEFVQG